MKRILFVLALVMCLPVLAKPIPFYGRTGTEIILKLSYDEDARGFERTKRAPVFIPVIASHDSENLYFSSRISIGDATIVVKDERENVVYEVNTSMLSGEDIVLPLNIEKGRYTLEITYGSICLTRKVGSDDLGTLSFYFYDPVIVTSTGNNTYSLFSASSGDVMVTLLPSETSY